MPSPEEVPSGGDDHTCEPLACVSCRSRKLKCDRVTPVCARCAKANTECSYPESRRKPATKRRNVKELEERLAQVEGMLKDVGKPVAAEKAFEAGGSLGDSSATAETAWPGGEFDFDESFVSNLLNGDAPPISAPSLSGVLPISQGISPEELDSFMTGDLIGLGQFEALPPFDMIEELHQTFFQRQQWFIPIIHQTRYLQAFHGAPHMRPPMCLQYALWTLAANGHPKYGAYHDVFYQRARKYLEADELKGYGEFFLTIAHAQAWALTATDEARCLLFTRASMSSARCARLTMMMGLHRLDDDSPDGGRLMAPTIAPPQSWAELEERRRCLWGAFCIDSHASISTGWPNLFDMTEITTRLPASEEAFSTGRKEEAPTIHEAFTGSTYSTFAGMVVICHVFNQILKHVHRPTPNDRADDVEYGPFWKRHREIDNMLSGAFMFLPERFRLPKSMRDPVAVQTNLNLHASVICLHNAACDKADKHKLPSQVKMLSQIRALTAAQEIVNIMKLTSHIRTTYRNPMAALSLYTATTVYIYQAKDEPAQCQTENLQFLITCMEAVGREHLVTRAFLQQIMLDLERNNITAPLRLPPPDKLFEKSGMCANNIPLLARSSVSHHSEMQPPLPGRLPLHRPQGTPIMPSANAPHCMSQYGPPLGHVDDLAVDESAATATDGPQHGAKRKRGSLDESSPATSSSSSAAAAASATKSSPLHPALSTAAALAITTRLPHRGSSASPSMSGGGPTPASAAGSGTLVGTPGGFKAATMPTTSAGEVDLSMFRATAEEWDLSADPGDQGAGFVAQIAELFEGGTGFDADPSHDSWVPQAFPEWKR